MPSRASRMPAAELAARIRAGTAPAVLDVRSRREYVQGHVPGALHAPFWRVRSALEALSLPRDEEIVVYCGHGPRAWLARAALRREGFPHLSLLEGHMAGWRRAGLPVARTRP